MTNIVINADARDTQGKGASRRLRRSANRVPAVVYGGDKEAQMISLLHKDVVKAAEEESFFSQLIKLNIDNKEELVVMRDMQRHPAKPIIMHIDFMRVSADKAITQRVPIHFLNEAACVGVKVQGGRISRTATSMMVTSVPGKLPQYIELDMKDVNAGQIVHISDIKLPEGVEAADLKHGHDHDLPVVTVIIALKAGGKDEDK